MKRYLMAVFTAAAFSVMLPGCAAGGGAVRETDGDMPETRSVTPDIPEGEPDASFSETGETGTPEDGETENEGTENMMTDGVDAAENADSAYREILDMFYYKITGGWDQTEDVSYMFYWDYSTADRLDDAGYAMTDLDGNGVPELLVSTMENAADGLIYDLYTFVDGEAVHTASSGERYCYYLCADNTVYYWGSSGASNSTEIFYRVNPDTGKLHPDKIVAFDQYEDKNNPWFYGTMEGDHDRRDGLDFGRMTHITEEEAENIRDGYQVTSIDLIPFSEYTPQGGMTDELRLKQAFYQATAPETGSYCVCDDFDGDGRMEAFGITGTDDGYGLKDASIYYIDPDGVVSCMDTFQYLYGYGGIAPGLDMNMVMDAGAARFLVIGGADGQETWLYGVRDGAAYQPAVSGQHADFTKTEDGRFIAQPHEGGEGYYILYYDFDPGTGEFVTADGESRNAVSGNGETGTGHVHSYTESVTSAPSCGTSGIKTFTCSCGDTYTETMEPTGEHDWEKRQELVSHEKSGSRETTVVKWTSVCRTCGATRNF